MMSLTFRLFTQVSHSGPHDCPVVCCFRRKISCLLPNIYSIRAPKDIASFALWAVLHWY